MVNITTNELAKLLSTANIWIDTVGHTVIQLQCGKLDYEYCLTLRLERQEDNDIENQTAFKVKSVMRITDDDMARIISNGKEVFKGKA